MVSNSGTAESPEAALVRFLDTVPKNTKIGVAVSGGSDSTGLLVALSQLTGADHVMALTVDHGLRPESNTEAMAVGSLCHRSGIKHEILRWTGAKPATGLQAAARNARYELLSKAAAHHQLDAIVTAHTADDQAETLTMRKKRSGSENESALAGIAPATLYGEKIWYLRPLLGVRRAAIRSYLEGQGTRWIDDPSNDDIRFERVRIRKSTPDDAGSLSAAWQARHARSVLVAEILKSRARRTDSDHFSLDTDELSDAQTADALAVLIEVAGGRQRALAGSARDGLNRYVCSRTAQKVTIGRAIIWRDGERINICREKRNVAPLAIKPGENAIWDGRYRIGNRSSGNGTGRTIGVRGDVATGILPDFHVLSGDCQVKMTDISVERLLGRASHLLPVFELPQSDAMAQICGRSVFPRCPWKKCMASALS